MNYKNSEELSSTTFYVTVDVDVSLNKQKYNSELLCFKKRVIKINPLKKIPNAGYGSCRACDCKGYKSKHDGSHECKTCGHHYDRHNSA